MKTRQHGLDLGRLIAMFFVIMLHEYAILTSMYPPLRTSPVGSSLGFGYQLTIIAKSFVNVFFLISGAYVLKSARTIETASFYRKARKRLGIPTLIFSLIFFVSDLAFKMVAGYLNRDNLFTAEGLGTAVIDLLSGKASTHLWYMFVLIGLYLLAPFICKAREMLGERGFTAAAWIMLIWGTASALSGSNQFTWDVRNVLAYAGIYMMGYVLFQKYSGTKDNRKAAFFFLLAAVLCAANHWLVLFLYNRGMSSGLVNALLSQESYGPSKQLIGMLLFLGFLTLDYKRDVSYLSGLTYWVYLIHPLIVLWLTAGVIERHFGFIRNASDFMAFMVLLAYGVLTYIISMLLSALYTAVTKK